MAISLKKDFTKLKPQKFYPKILDSIEHTCRVLEL